MSNSILEPVKVKDPKVDIPLLWDVAIRRVTDAKREDEINVPESLINLGADIAYRAFVLSKAAGNDKEAKGILAKIFGGRVYLPMNVAARVNSLYTFHKMTDEKGKTIKLSDIDKVLRCLNDPTEPVDHSSKGLYPQSYALVKATFRMRDEKSRRFESRPLVEENDEGIELSTPITHLIKAQPDRYEAILSLILDRRVPTVAQVKSMMSVSQANAMMDGAL